jgi:acetate kinase
VKVLVINVGSTSLKYDLYQMDSEARLAHGTIERVATRASVDAAIAGIGERLRDELAGLGAVGHRVVHGGERLVQPTVIDAGVEATVAECAVFAPLHNSVNLEGIRAAHAAFPNVPHVAVFDTAFHSTMPEHAYLYAVPYELYVERRVRRYGFHGPSHQYMALCAADALRRELAQLRLVTCHLGGGASVAAIDGGVSIDTSMGMTPLEGLVMATRSGDVDPAMPLLLARWGTSFDDIDTLLNGKSGLAGISGISGDFRELEAAANQGHRRARLAIDMFVHRLQRYIGGYVAELGGADAIVFTGGIGEHAAGVRERVCRNLGFMGVAIDGASNVAARPETSGGTVDVSSPDARTRVLVVHTEEEKMIAREVMRCLAGSNAAPTAGDSRR